MTKRRLIHSALAWLVIIAMSLACDAVLYWIYAHGTMYPFAALVLGNFATLLVMMFFLGIGSRERERQTVNSEAALRLRLLAMRRAKYPDVPENLLLASEETLAAVQADADQQKASNDNDNNQGRLQA